MKRIAIVNQRYGVEVNGGSEYFTRMIAEHLSKYFDVQILTTCALEYDTWKNYYPDGVSTVNEIVVKRFKVTKERNPTLFRNIDRIVRYMPFKSKILEEIWIRCQGPYCPQLIEYIKKNKDNYDVFIFVTYLYYVTVHGLGEVSEKSILIPTAHDEPYIYLKKYKKIFQSPMALIYLTEEEKLFVENLFYNRNKNNKVIGMGIDVPLEPDIEGFRSKFEIKSEYIIYVGRIDSGKNCEELFDFFLSYQTNRNTNLTLILLGKAYIKVPESKFIKYLGFVSEKEKYEGIGGAKALCLPSKFESFSIAVLEAMALGTTVIVNGNCSVLRGHCEKSGSGYCYSNINEFQECLDKLNEDKKQRNMKLLGKQYVEQNYQWNKILKEYQKVINSVIER